MNLLQGPTAITSKTNLKCTKKKNWWHAALMQTDTGEGGTCEIQTGEDQTEVDFLFTLFTHSANMMSVQI